MYISPQLLLNKYPGHTPGVIYYRNTTITYIFRTYVYQCVYTHHPYEKRPRNIHTPTYFCYTYTPAYITVTTFMHTQQHYSTDYYYQGVHTDIHDCIDYHNNISCNIPAIPHHNLRITGGPSGHTYQPTHSNSTPRCSIYT